MPFPCLVAFQPAIPGSSSAPDTFFQTAASHCCGTLPHRTTLPTACHWKGTRQLDLKGKSLPQVNWWLQFIIFYVIVNADYVMLGVNSSMLFLRHLARVTDIDATDTSNPNLNYGLVVDCGSSGSRVFVYCWPRHNGNPHELLDIRQMRDLNRKPVVMKIKPGKTPSMCFNDIQIANLKLVYLLTLKLCFCSLCFPSGISELAKTPEKASDYIYPLLSFAAQHIPKNKHQETPLYILCTAGMRILPERYSFF